ncbi:MAG: FkbM family methyltransferase, partial [Chloroflexi bacterium]
MLGMYRKVGWQRSVRTGLPVGPDGEAIPWFSYPALAWLDAVVTGSERVFEFGSGNSTVWFSRRVAEVVSVE